MKQGTVVHLPYYIPQDQDILGYSAGCRPYRDGGIRMEKEIIGSKNFYHHYGHGGGGISLAYGCCKHVIDNLFKEDHKGDVLAVLGGGIIGITTALQLIQKGYRVKMYSELMPFQLGGKQPEITTTVAAGYWMPLKVGNKNQTIKYATDTWRHYQTVAQEQIKLKKKLGIELVQSYCLNDDQGLTFMEIDGVIKPQAVQVDFGDGHLVPGFRFPTYIIESEKYLPYLFQKLFGSGKFSLERRQFTKIDEILGISEKNIFNCLGLGAKWLIPGEKSMKSIKGHVIKFQGIPSQMDHVLFMKANGRFILQVPHRQSNKLCLGISYEEGKTHSFVEQQEVDQILKASRDFFRKVEGSRPRPKL